VETKGILTLGSMRWGMASRWLVAAASPSSSFIMVWASSDGSSASGTPHTAVVRLGEAPLDNKSVREASSRFGGGGAFVKRAVAGFSALRGVVGRRYYRGKLRHVVQGLHDLIPFFI
jgi:hypothetical protein